MAWWRKFVGKARGGARPPAPEGGGGCDDHPEAVHLRQGTPAFEEFVARGELEAGHDLRHGATHLANLLTYDPGRPEWLELLERYVAAAGPDPEALIPRDETLYAATEAVRAYLWHKQGRLADAVGLLVSVVHAKNDAAYLEAWALDWLEPAGAVESLPDPVGLNLFISALSRFPEARQATLPRLRQLRRWARLSERFAAGRAGPPQAAMMRVGLLRKAGLFDEAEAIARRAFEHDPDWHSATALGLVLRATGDAPGAEAAFRRAVELEPSDVSARLEAGDLFFNREEWPQALDWYEEALAREAGQPWALASSLYCRWKMTGDERHLQLLTDLARGENPRARALAQRAYGVGLPEPRDASANVLRQVLKAIREHPEKGRGGEVRIGVSSLEAPSNALAFRMQMEALGRDVRLRLDVGQVPTPDPREPIEPMTYRLWAYDGTVASPGLPRPAVDVSEAIARLAATPYDEPVNWADASRVAEPLGPARVGEVLATMVHPPPVPEGLGALAWLPRVQLAAAQVAAQVDEGWEGSARREALLSVLLGPQDWATDAAIRVLARLAHEDESLADDVHQAFQRLADHRPDQGYWSWEETLYRYWVGLPGLFPGGRDELAQKLRRLEQRDESEDGS